MKSNDIKVDYQTPMRNFQSEIGNLREYVESIEDMVANRSKLTKKLSKEVIPFILRSSVLQESEDQKLLPEEIEKFEKRYGRKVEFEEIYDNGKKRVNIIWESDDERQISFKALDKSIQIKVKENKHIQATNELAFIKLITLVEWFLSQILRVHLLNYPNALDTSSKTFSLDDLKNFDSINFAHEYLIDETIGKITRGSFESWIDYLKGSVKNQKKEKSINVKSNSLNLDLEIINDIIPKLIEAHQRRNLLVHNNGIVNKIYLKNIPRQLETEAPELDSSISILPSYLEESIQNFEFCFLIIGSEIMKKAPKGTTESRIEYISKAQFENLKNKRFSIAKKYGEYIQNDSEASEDNKLYAKINNWLAIKLDSGLEGIKNEVANEDFRSRAKLYKMAKALVLDDYEVAIPLIKKLLSRDNNQNKLILAEKEKINTLTNRLKKEKSFVSKNKVQEEKAIAKVENSQKTVEATIDEIIISRQNLADLRAESFELHINDLRDWPLFEDFRSSHKKLFSEFNQKYNHKK